jgi:SulP family sulfate permease
VSGLLVATALAGVLMLAMGVFGLGRLIQFVPHPVTTGFTAGIAVVIAVLQLGELLGLGRLEGERLWDRLQDLMGRAAELNWPDLAVGLLTIAVIALWPRVARRVPSPLVALVVATLGSLFLIAQGFEVATINTDFGGVPSGFPTPAVPWAGLTLDDVSDLMPTALAIALLGAIESLLCAVVADGMTGGRHDPDGELIGLGLGNIVAPFFGGFAATGAIARTATGIRAGGRTPVAVVVHSFFLLAAMLALAPLLGHIPMAAMAGLLLVVAWNMSDAKHFARIVRIAPRSDVMVLIVCFVLTVVFDMVVAVLVGVVLAALLFMRRMVEISGATLVGGPQGHAVSGLPPGVVFYDVAGPLFFGAAEKALEALTLVGQGVHTVIVDLEDVPAIDATGLVALETTIARLNGHGIKVVLSGVKPQPRRALDRAGFIDQPSRLEITDDTDITVERFIAAE